jgi:hypothetical protein
LIENSGEANDPILDDVFGKIFFKTGRLLQVSLGGSDGFNKSL